MAGLAQRLRSYDGDAAPAVGVVVVTVLLACVPRIRERFFYFWGDNAESFVPLWHHLGGELRQGRWLTMDPAGWMGGNYAAEAAYGICNPVTMANAVVLSSFDDLSTATFVLMTEFLALLGLGVYLLAREYGAGRAPAFLVGTAAPFAGFTLFYQAGNWASGLMAFVWVLHFWWSARRHARGQLSPVVPFLFGALAVTTGNPYGVVAVVVVLAALGTELLVQRSWTRLTHLVIVGVGVGLVTVLVLLPLMLTTEVTWRSGETPSGDNNAYLVPDLGDLAGLSTPSFRPTMDAWYASVDHVPSTYLAWFLLPLLPWLSWRRLRHSRGGMVSLLGVGAVYLTLTLAPSSLWMFRWPLRMVEYLYLVLLVLFALAMSTGLRGDHARRRAAGSALVVLFGAYLAWAGEPDFWQRHLVAAAVVLALLAVAALGARQAGAVGLVTALVVGTAGIAGLQAGWFWWRAPGAPEIGVLHDIGVPYDLERIRASAQGYEGTMLQVASVVEPLTQEELESGQLVFGNVAVAAGIDTVVRYTGIGYLDLAQEINLNYRGETGRAPYQRLFEPAGEGVPVPLVDAMRVSTVVVQNSYISGMDVRPAPEGWRVAERNDTRTVLLREMPLPLPGDVGWVRGGTQVASAEYSPTRSRVRVVAGEGGGEVLFSRLAWPGYHATVDGAPVPVTEGPAGLVTVEVPEGEHELVLGYRTPGLTAGLAALAAAVLLVGSQSVVWWARRGRS